jgi:Protein of unknown function (DUF3102)
MTDATSDPQAVALSTSDNGKPDHCVVSDRDQHAQPAATATAGFDYAALPPADAEDLRDRAGRLRGLFKKLSANIIAIGRDLIEVKDRLAHGQFENWIERELGVGIRAAQYYMAVARFTDGKSETVALLPPSTLRILAAKSAPSKIVDQVIARAASGDIVADVAVKTMIANDKVMRRQAKSASDAAKRKSKEGRAARNRKAAAQEAARLATEEHARANRARAQSIIDRFSSEDVGFLANTLTWDILEEFKRLVVEAGAP